MFLNRFDYKISYSNSGSNQELLNVYKNIDISIKYQINKKYYMKIGYSKDMIDDDLYDTYIDIGVSFE